MGPSDRRAATISKETRTGKKSQSANVCEARQERVAEEHQFRGHYNGRLQFSQDEQSGEEGRSQATHYTTDICLQATTS